MKFVSNKIKMKSVARLAAVQAVYMMEYGQLAVDQVIKDFMDGKIGRFVLQETLENQEEEVIELSELDRAYFEKLARGVAAKKEEIEKSLTTYLNESWSFERMDGTLQALLLCAVYELLYTLDVDAKVIIQEYVDLAYAFFFKNEPKMVNALLDQIAKEVR